MTSTLEQGRRLTTGVVFRRVPNTKTAWDERGNVAARGAFRPLADSPIGIPKNAISVFLASRTNERQVLTTSRGRFLEDYGLVTIDIEELEAEIALVRASPGGGQCPVVNVTEWPLDVSVGGPVGAAHCYLEPVPVIVQKTLVRLCERRVYRRCRGVLLDSGLSAMEIWGATEA